MTNVIRELFNTSQVSLVQGCSRITIDIWNLMLILFIDFKYSFYQKLYSSATKNIHLQKNAAIRISHVELSSTECHVNEWYMNITIIN